jgi:hypothetical protein
MRKRTPQEKKQLSYERDRRNNYGEAPHAARKSIPLRKALGHRADRHSQNQPLKNLIGYAPDEEQVEFVESQIHHNPPNDWEKYPDAPLGEIIARKKTEREVMRTQGGRRALRVVRHDTDRDS